MVAKDLFGNEIPEVPDEKFELPDGSYIWESNLKEADEETQKAAMRSWFFSHFENPAEETPYDSGEGGYQYIGGGPFEVPSRFL